MAIIEIPDDWLESTGLSPEEAKDYLLSGYPVMKELCLLYMASTTIRTPPNSIIGSARIILDGLAGPVTKQQAENLGLIIHSAEHLFESLTTFTNVVPSIFGPHKIYLKNIDIHKTISSTVLRAMKNCEFKADYHIPDGDLTIQSDRMLLERLIFGMLEIVKQIHPTHKGKVSISARKIGLQVEIEVKTAQDAEYPFNLDNKNPIVFMAHSLAKELKGEFRIEQKDTDWQIITSLPIKHE